MRPSVGFLSTVAVVSIAGGLASIAVLRSDGRDVWPLNDRPQEFEGLYEFGFENSAFLPCRQSQVPPRSYWLVVREGVNLNGELRELGFDRILDEPGPAGYGRVVLRFEGTLDSAPGRLYGHMGAYGGEVEVQRLISVSREGSCE